MKKEVDIYKVLKNEWVAQFLHVEAMVDPTWEIHMVHYEVCFMVEGKEKLLNPKLDGLQKIGCTKKENLNSSSKTFGGLLLQQQW